MLLIVGSSLLIRSFENYVKVKNNSYPETFCLENKALLDVLETVTSNIFLTFFLIIFRSMIYQRRRTDPKSFSLMYLARILVSQSRSENSVTLR